MDKLFDFLGQLRIPTSIIIGTVWIVSGIMIFAPEQYLTKLGLYEFKISYNGIIGMIFLISFALIVLFCVSYLYKLVRAKYNWHQRRKRLKEMIKDNYNIKEILFDAYNNDMNIYEESTNSNIIYLLNEQVLYQPRQVVTVGWENEMRMRYVVQPWAKKIVKAYFEE